MILAIRNLMVYIMSSSLFIVVCTSVSDKPLERVFMLMNDFSCCVLT